MKCAIIALTVVVIMHDISIHRLNRKFEILKSFFDTVIRQLEETVSERTEKEFTAYDSAKISHDCIGLCDIKKKLNREDEPQTCSVNGRPYDCGNCEYHKCTADEPQIIACPINERAEYWFYKDEPQTDYGDYERAVEQMQHDMRYEPTYNAEDGSM